MRLKTYIEQIGDKKAAKIFKVKERTVASWRRGERTPKREQSAIIVRVSPVTYEGIYAPDQEAA